MPPGGIETGRADDVAVRDVQEKHRYEVLLAGEVVGFAAYRPREGHRTFTHTEVDPGHEGRGLGSRLARESLEDVRARGLTLTPACPFIARFIAENEEYGSLVAAAPRDA